MMNSKCEGLQSLCFTKYAVLLTDLLHKGVAFCLRCFYCTSPHHAPYATVTQFPSGSVLCGSENGMKKTRLTYWDSSILITNKRTKLRCARFHKQSHFRSSTAFLSSPQHSASTTMHKSSGQSVFPTSHFLLAFYLVSPRQLLQSDTVFIILHLTSLDLLHSPLVSVSCFPCRPPWTTPPYTCGLGHLRVCARDRK